MSESRIVPLPGLNAKAQPATTTHDASHEPQGSESWDNTTPVPTVAASEQAAAPVPTLNIWRPSQFMKFKIPPGYDILGDGIIQVGEMTCLIGQGGTGKSRLSLFLALCQITGREWCGLPTHGPARKWLFLGNENSVVRFQRDLEKLFVNFSAEELAKIEEYLRLPAVLGLDDSLLSMESKETQQRLSATIEQERPDVVVIDPFEAFMDGDVNLMPDVRATVTALNQTIRRHVPHAAILIVHHARTGAANQRQGADLYNSGNFAKGAKSLYSMVRSQINLMPGDPEDETKLVLACGKANNSTRFETRGLKMDPDTFYYGIDTGFSLSAWMDDIDGKRGRKSASIMDVLSVVKAGKTKRGDIAKAVGGETACGSRTANARITDARKGGYLDNGTERGTYRLTEKGEHELCK
jgi:hypothetical protein